MFGQLERLGENGRTYERCGFLADPIDPLPALEIRDQIGGWRVRGVALPDPIRLAEPCRVSECADPDGVRCQFRPFIEDVVDRMPDLMRRTTYVRRIPCIKGLFSDTALTK